MKRVLIILLAGSLLTACQSQRVLWDSNHQIPDPNKRVFWDTKGKMKATERKIWMDETGQELVR